MKSKNIILALIAVLTLTTQTAVGQNYEVKPQLATADDYIKLLNYMNYRAYAYDISSLLDSTRTIELCFREYYNGELAQERYINSIRNRRMISEFSNEDQDEILKLGLAYDAANDILRITDKIITGFTPLKNDSTEMVFVDYGQGGASFPLRVKPAIDTKTGTTLLRYETRPFMISTFQFDTFIPLVLYGSWWYDERFDVFRFCGENELEPDMTSDLLKEIPHYYIIGIKIKR